MRIDFENRAIVCSVGDLVHENTYRRIGVERGDGFRRMWIGQDIHSKRADLRAGEDPFYRPEVHVSYRTAARGWSVTVTGRIDGMSVDRDGKRISVEEVKSLHFDLELEALYRSEKLQRHLYQLLLYALFLVRQEEYAGFALAPQLVLIDLVSGETKIIDAEFDAATVQSTLKRSLDRLVESIETARALSVPKRSFAKSLGIPYQEMRPFQGEKTDAVWPRRPGSPKASSFPAPTGVGENNWGPLPRPSRKSGHLARNFSSLH